MSDCEFTFVKMSLVGESEGDSEHPSQTFTSASSPFSGVTEEPFPLFLDFFLSCKKKHDETDSGIARVQIRFV